MARGSTGLDNYNYDKFLAKNHKERELRDRHDARKNKGFTGWQFGISTKPFKANSKEEFHRELEKRGCLDAHSMKEVNRNGKKSHEHR